MTRLLALSAALALSLAACATPPVSPNKAAAANARPPAGCVAQSASRIPVKDNSMACAGFGNTYTKEDLDKTGQIYPDKALSMLDPSIRSTGH